MWGYDKWVGYTGLHSNGEASDVQWGYDNNCQSGP